jgi:hypothetical protein
MLLLLAALIAEPLEREQVVYYCTSPRSAAEFSLVYDRRGARISKVRIVDRETPRLPPDHATRWRGTPDGKSVRFRFHHSEKGLWTNGEMDLVPDPGRPGHFRLTWSSTMGAVGGHIPLETPEASADCVPLAAHETSVQADPLP